MTATEETKAKMQEVRKLMNGGMGVIAACRQAKLPSSAWYNHTNKAGGKKAKIKKTKAPTYVDLTPAQTASVAIILCAHDQIKTILAGLK